MGEVSRPMTGPLVCFPLLHILIPYFNRIFIQVMRHFLWSCLLTIQLHYDHVVNTPIRDLASPTIYAYTTKWEKEKLLICLNHFPFMRSSVIDIDWITSYRLDVNCLQLSILTLSYNNQPTHIRCVIIIFAFQVGMRSIICPLNSS